MEELINTMTVDEQKNLLITLLPNLTSEMITTMDKTIKQTLFQKLWADKIRSDVINHSQTLDAALNEDGIQYIIHHCVYQNEYDSELPYWDNIENFIYDAYDNEAYRWIDPDDLEKDE